MDNYSLSDVAAVTRKADGMGFGSEGLWIFALLILLFGNGGFGLGGGNAVEQGDLQRAIDLNSIQNGQRDIESKVQEVGAENISLVKDGQYNLLSEMRDLQSQIASNATAMQNCCCETQSMIMENRYLDSQNTASINANTTAQTQRILDALCQNKIEALQSRINELELNNAMCGVPKVNPFGYGIVPQFAVCPTTATTTTTS